MLDSKSFTDNAAVVLAFGLCNNKTVQNLDIPLYLPNI